ncbi:hypothetical protein [Nonomuraea rhizosphaerae]|uniref:hypothetical protein n=1 Tax=Nonomuraea rhizosphaerae TaxID=2665663 RepID=UPI001C5EF0AC|nr:hypothetical protein [Nonomuraea rhizosphaerae]
MVAGLGMCALTSAVPSTLLSVGAQVAPMSAQFSDPPAKRLVEDVFYVTQGIEVADRLLPFEDDVTITPADLAPGVTMDASGRLHGTPRRSGTFAAPVRLCRGQDCAEQQVTVVVLPNVPWRPSGLTFPGKVGVRYDEQLAVDGGPAGVPATFSVTDHAKLPEDVTIGPDGHVGGIPAKPGVSKVPIRICVAGDCAGVVVTLIVV